MNKVDDLKRLLQLLLNQKSVRIYANGSIVITFKYKPNQMPINQNVINVVQEKLLTKLEAMTETKFKITKMQKEPSLCYNTYVKLISSSSAASQNKLKSFLKYFKQNEHGNFMKTSYKELIINLEPYSKEEFSNFLLKED